MKRWICRSFFFFLSIYILSQPAWAAKLLIPGGQVIGMHLQDDTVTVADFDPTLGEAARSAGARVIAPQNIDWEKTPVLRWRWRLIRPIKLKKGQKEPKESLFFL